MSSYYCIFKSTTSVNVTTTSGTPLSSVLSVSGCTCHGHCPSNTIAVREGHEDLAYIQEKCIGHRLTSNTYRGQTLPQIDAHSSITHQQYNLLKDIINKELDSRKKSPLYSNADKPAAPTALKPADYVKREQLQKLNKFVSRSSFYKDTVIAPVIPLPEDEGEDKPQISHVHINNTINAVKAMLNDCICYSDCNGYSTCQCYGNCNHY